MADRLSRGVLRSPALVRRAAATQAKEPEERWMLRQASAVRESYVREVLDRGGDARLAEIWMLGQPEGVRKSYVAEVLEPALPEKLRRTSQRSR
ncbi:MAG: hypothetical protein NVSMB25_18340 [Thermoleophilaceae bacterium]